MQNKMITDAAQKRQEYLSEATPQEVKMGKKFSHEMQSALRDESITDPPPSYALKCLEAMERSAGSPTHAPRTVEERLYAWSWKRR